MKHLDHALLVLVPVIVFIAPLKSSRVPASLPDPVHIDSGMISGSADTTGVVAFKGIPYAAPPIAELRWREPAPAQRWQRIREAKEFSRPCMQNLVAVAPPTIPAAAFDENLRMAGPVTEDCLYLNVWTAAKSENERRPVVVWIPGGGFVSGSPAYLATDGTELAKQGVVLVSISYRLSLFGFLSHPELTRESPHKSSGNYGSLDQLAALQWVHRNISKFGGDPNNVTIFGQSAGAMSVQALMASPLARGLFHRVIAFSGSMFPGLNLLPALRNAATVKAEKISEAEQRGLKFAQSIGASSLRELRARRAEELLKASTGGAPVFGVATVDGWFLPNDVPSILGAGKQNDVPIMIGWDANEGESFAPAAFRLDAFKDHVRDQYGAGAETFWSLYPAATEDQGRASYVTYVRDLGFAFPVRTWARVQHMTGKAPAFLFFFERTPPDEPARGAHHGAELTYAFHNIRRSQRPFNAIDQKLSDAMAPYLVHFAASGDPNGSNLTKWQSYDDRRDELLALGDRIEPRQVPNKAALDFFETTIGRFQH